MAFKICQLLFLALISFTSFNSQAACTPQIIVPADQCAFWNGQSSTFCGPIDGSSAMIYMCDAPKTGSCDSASRNLTTGACPVTQINCPVSSQYAPPGSTSTAQCIPIPNCNISTPVDGNYFNVSSGQCENGIPGVEMTICITGNPPISFFCPPLNSCLSKMSVCNNSPIVIAEANATRAADIAAVKAAADIKKVEAAQAAQLAATAAAAKVAAKMAAQNEALAAKAISDAVNASPNSIPSQMLQATQAYESALSKFVAAAAKAANSLLASGVSSSAAGEAETHSNMIPSSIPGNAQAYGDMVSDDLHRALIASNDAVTGLGSGQGTGQGESEQTCQDTGTCDGVFSGAQSDGGMEGGLTAGYLKGKEIFCGSGDCDISPTCATGQCSSQERLNVIKTALTPVGAVSSGNCPVVDFDLSVIGLGSPQMNSHCLLLEQVRPTIAVVGNFIAALSFILIILGA